MPDKIACSIKGEHAPIGACPVDVPPGEPRNHLRRPNLAQEMLCQLPTRIGGRDFDMIYWRGIHGGSRWCSLFSAIAMRQNFRAVNP